MPVLADMYPILARTPWGLVTTSCPATVARPLEGRKTVLKIRSVVVLPAPLGPSKPKIAPGWHSNEMSLIALFQPR
jgi:hypothetical protein